MRKVIAVAALVATAALATATGIGAEGNHDVVAGAGDQYLAPEVTHDIGEFDHYSVGAVSDPDGTNAHGEITYRSTAIPGTFHGDVGEGCMIVAGNVAVVVGKLPPSEFIELPPFGTVEYVGVTVVDNGHPVDGQPTDLASAVLLFTTSAQRVCAGRTPFPPQPLTHGNFVVHDAE